MRTATVTTVLDASQEAVFAYMADIENLPRWATEFARELRREGDVYKVVNGLGEFFFELRADERTGVIDMHAGPAEDQMAIFPTRAAAESFVDGDPFVLNGVVRRSEIREWNEILAPDG